MHQYGMSSYYLDVVVADFSYPLWRTDLRIDAIITDREYKKVQDLRDYKLYKFFKIRE